MCVCVPHLAVCPCVSTHTLTLVGGVCGVTLTTVLTWRAHTRTLLHLTVLTHKPRLALAHIAMMPILHTHTQVKIEKQLPVREVHVSHTECCVLFFRWQFDLLKS